MPQIWAVQSEHCDPLLQGAERGEKDPAQVTSKPTLAEGIAIGVPMRGRAEVRSLKEKLRAYGPEL